MKTFTARLRGRNGVTCRLSDTIKKYHRAALAKAMASTKRKRKFPTDDASLKHVKWHQPPSTEKSITSVYEAKWLEKCCYFCVRLFKAA